MIHARSAAEASAFLNPCATTLEEFGIQNKETVAVHCIVKDGNPAEAMADAIAQYHPSILVAGVKRTVKHRGLMELRSRCWRVLAFLLYAFRRSRRRRTGPGILPPRCSR